MVQHGLPNRWSFFEVVKGGTSVEAPGFPCSWSFSRIMVGSVIVKFRVSSAHSRWLFVQSILCRFSSFGSGEGWGWLQLLSTTFRFRRICAKLTGSSIAIVFTLFLSQACSSGLPVFVEITYSAFSHSSPVFQVVVDCASVGIQEL